MSSLLDHNQVLGNVHDVATGTLKVFPGAGTLINFNFDYIAITYPSGTQEVYTFKLGGSGGTTTGTITVNYTDSTKANISSVART